MKLLLLMFLLAFESPAQTSCKIVGSLKYCDSNEIEYGRKMIAISKDGVVLDTKIQTGFKGSFEISGLSPITYVVGYDNVFGQRVRKTVEVKETITSVDLCIDEFQDTNVSTLFNTMKDGDSLVITLSSYGCFHSLEEEFTVVRENKKYSLYYMDKKNKTIMVALDNEKLNYLIRFEKIVRHLHKKDGGCTTTDGYSFSKNGEMKFSASDNTCSWHGVTKIRKYLLGQK